MTTRTISTFAPWTTVSDSVAVNMSAITVKDLKRSSSGGVEVRVCVRSGDNAEEHSFLLIDEFFARLDICVGAISRERLCDVEFWSRVTDAYFSACRSFAFAPSSLKMLRAKLIGKGFERDVADQAIEHLHSRGYVDEQDIALRRAEIFVGKLWGQTRILSKLSEEGFGDDAAEAVCDYLESIDMVELCSRLIDKKYGGVPEGRAERDKLCAALYRYGYSPSEIKLAISRACNG